MPLFTVIGLDHLPHATGRRDALRAEHRAYVSANDAAIQLAGPLRDSNGDQIGSFYIFEADSEQQVRDWLASEPFAKGGVYENVLVHGFQVGRNLLPSRDW